MELQLSQGDGDVNQMHQTIEVMALYELHTESSGLRLIDVRETDEVAAVRSSFATNFPLSKLTAGNFGDLTSIGRNEPLFVICRSGARSQKACGIFREHGFTNVVNVTGGMLAWEAAGLPVLRK